VFAVRFHGRGGQGVVTAAELLASAAFSEDRYAQAFPSFGLERMGAPVMSFCRIDDRPIRTHEPVSEPGDRLGQDPASANRSSRTSSAYSLSAPLLPAGGVNPMDKPFAITLDPGSSRANHTGAWRTERPVYVSLLPPCNNACPVGENIQQWLYHAEEGGLPACRPPTTSPA
jgi:hypothetical protein